MKRNLEEETIQRKSRMQSKQIIASILTVSYHRINNSETRKNNIIFVGMQHESAKSKPQMISALSSFKIFFLNQNFKKNLKNIMLMMQICDLIGTKFRPMENNNRFATQ